jgi:hypothetical protein
MYLAKLSFLVGGEIKTFHDKQKLKEFVATKPALQESYTQKRKIITTRKI